MLLIENQITEGKRENKHWFLEGVFAQSETVNKNNRIYRDKILSREMTNYVNEFVKTKRAVGELSHPESSQINPDRVSILIESIEKIGNDYFGKAKVLDTPCGKIVQAMLEGGVVVGVSTRGSGSLRKLKNGISEVCDDFKLHTIDVVLNPSAPKALVSSIYENEKIEKILKEFSNEEDFFNFIKEREKTKKLRNKINREMALIEAFEKFIKTLKDKE